MDGSSFNAAFDMPETPAQARAVLAEWGKLSVAAFSRPRAKRCAQLLSEPLHPVAEVESVLAELTRAVAKFPTWPSDILHASTVVQEEAGELAKEALQLVYEPHKTSLAAVECEAIQTAAMAIRFLISIRRYSYSPSGQHTQEPQP